MADIKVVGTDIESGQNKPITSGDTIRPETGDLTVSAGDPAGDDADGDNLSLLGGNGGNNSGAGGDVVISAGVTPTDGIGGSVSIFATDAQGSNFVGGDVNITSGDGTGGAPFTGTGGDINITTGDGGSSTQGGNFTVTCGGPTGGTAGGGNVTLLAGTGSGGGSGGGVDIQAGDGPSRGNIDIGTVYANNLTLGNSETLITFNSRQAAITTVHNGGSNSIDLTVGVSTGGVGSDITLTAGGGFDTDVGGNVNITAGQGGDTASGGSVTIAGGASGATSGDGGAVILRGGIPTDGNGGGIDIAARNALGTNRNGGTLTLSAGDATGTGTAGVIDVTSGTSPSGTQGFIRLYTGTTGAVTERARFEPEGTLTLGDGTGTSISSPGFASYSLLAYRNSANFWANYAFSSNTTDSPDLDFVRGRGTVASRSSVADGDTIGTVRFGAFRAPAATAIASTITSKVVGTPVVGVGGTLEFATQPNGGTVPIDRWFITDTGNFVKQTQGNYILTERSVTARTADLVLAHSNSFGVFTTEGASGTVNFTLPSAAAGMEFEFYVMAAQTLQITAASGDTIRIGTSESAAAGNVTNNVIGSYIKLQSLNNTNWVASAPVGTWTVT